MGFRLRKRPNRNALRNTCTADTSDEGEAILSQTDKAELAKRSWQSSAVNQS